MGITSLSILYPDVFKDKIVFSITRSCTLGGRGSHVTSCPQSGSQACLFKEGVASSDDCWGCF